MANISLKIKRQKGITKLVFNVDKEIRDLYENMEHEKRESGNWPGLHFYFIPQIIDSRKYQEMLSAYGLFDDFGSKVYHSGRFNIAFLRTIEGSGEIIIKEHIAFADLSNWMQKMTSFLKDYHEGFFADCEVNGEVKINL